MRQKRKDALAFAWLLRHLHFVLLLLALLLKLLQMLRVQMHLLLGCMVAVNELQRQVVHRGGVNRELRHVLLLTIVLNRLPLGVRVCVSAVVLVLIRGEVRSAALL